MQDLPLKLDRLCLAEFWKVRNQCDLVVDNPAHGRRVGTKWSLRSPPTKTVSWFYEGNIKMFRKETWILGEVLLFFFFFLRGYDSWVKQILHWGSVDSGNLLLWSDLFLLERISASQWCHTYSLLSSMNFI